MGSDEFQPLDRDERAVLREQCSQWAQTWLREAYCRCLSQGNCANEFGFAWRYQVPESRRREKCEGICLCRRYARSPGRFKGLEP